MIRGSLLKIGKNFKLAIAKQHGSFHGFILLRGCDLSCQQKPAFGNPPYFYLTIQLQATYVLFAQLLTCTYLGKHFIHQVWCLRVISFACSCKDSAHFQLFPVALSSFLPFVRLSVVFVIPLDLNFYNTLFSPSEDSPNSQVFFFFNCKHLHLRAVKFCGF